MRHHRKFYDSTSIQIVLHFAKLSSYKCNVRKKPLRSLCKCLQQLKHENFLWSLKSIYVFYYFCKETYFKDVRALNIASKEISRYRNHKSFMNTNNSIKSLWRGNMFLYKVLWSYFLNCFDIGGFFIFL